MSDEWYLQTGEEISGPVPFAELLAKGQAGELSLDDTIRQGTDGNWIPVESLSSLFPNLKPGGAGPAAAAPDPADELQEVHDLSELNFEIESRSSTLPADELVEASDLSEVTIDDSSGVNASAEAPPATMEELEEVHDLSELSVATAGPIEGTEEFELSHDPTHVEWFARVVGVEMGPMPWADLQQMAEHGELSVEDEVRPASHAEWTSAGEVPLLFTDTVSAGRETSVATSELDVVQDLSELHMEVEPPAGTTARSGDAPDESAAESAAVARAKSESWYANVLGGVHGPMSYDELRTMVLRNELGPADLVRRGEFGAWVRPEKFANLLDSTGTGLTREVAAASEDWYCNVFGAELGPMSFADVQAMARNHELAGDDSVRYGAKGEWVAANTVDALSNEFPSSTAESTATPQLSLAEFEFVESIEEAMPQVDAPPDFQTAAEPEPEPVIELVPEPAGIDAYQADAATADAATAADGFSEEVAPTDTGVDQQQPMTEQSGEPVTATVSVDEAATASADEIAAFDESPSTNEWYVRMHDVEHGPLEFEELQHLIEVNRISVESEVRLGMRGAWVRAGSVSSLAQAADSTTGTAASQSSPDWSAPSAAFRPRQAAASPPRSASQPRSESPLAALLAGHRDHLLWGGAVAVVIALLAVTIPLLFGGHDEDDLAVYTSIWNEHQELRARGAAQSEWNDFQQRVKEEIEPIVARLEKTAGAQNRIRQHLLWAGRDYLPLMVVDAREEPSESEELFIEHLEDAMTLMGGEVPDGPWVDEQEGRIDGPLAGGSDGNADDE